MIESVKRVLVVNPGSTSTKVGVYEIDRAETRPVDSARLPATPSAGGPLRDQLPTRLESIISFVEGFTPAADLPDSTTGDRPTGAAPAAPGKGTGKPSRIDGTNRPDTVDCIAARGGMVKPVQAGSYFINDALIADLLECRYGSHASNLGAPIARELAKRYGCDAIIADPVGVDELEPPARYSGLKGIERRSFAHTLNIREVSRRAAAEIRVPFESAKFVVTHLGGGISVAAVRGGRIIDVNNSNEGGPFTPQRSGSLPVLQLVDLCFSGLYDSPDQMHGLLTRSAGLISYLGTDDVREVLERIESGDREAREVFDAMMYQIAKEIGASAAALGSCPDRIVLTGGFAVSHVTDRIRDRVEWIAPVLVYEGEHEMIALADAARRFLSGEENPREY